MLFTFHFTNTHSDLIWDDVLFRYRFDGLSCLFVSVQATNTATKKIDFLSLAMDVSSGSRSRICTECTECTEFRRACLVRFISRSLLSMQRIPQMRQTARNGARQGPAIKSPTNDKQISHSGSPIYRCRNRLPHSSYAPRDILAVVEIIIEEYTGDE